MEDPKEETKKKVILNEVQSRKLANVLIVLMLGFLIGNGIIGCSQLDLSSVMCGHPLKVVFAYILGTGIMACLCLWKTTNNK